MRFLALFFMSLVLFANEPNLRTKISEMILVGFDGTSIKDIGTRIMLSDASYNRFGGVVLVNKNIQNKDQFKYLIKLIKQKNPNLFIGIDQNSEYRNLFKDKSFDIDIPSPSDISSRYDLIEASQLYEKFAKLANECGVNLNFAPNLDLVNSSAEKKENDKRYSQNVSKVSLYANILANFNKKFEILSVFKHFPAYVRVDGNNTNQIILTNESILAYESAIDLNLADAIMVSDLIIKNLDDSTPTSMSNLIVNGLIRDELGFKGIIISENMLLKDLNKMSLKDRIVRFIIAGGDMIYFGDYKMDKDRVSDLFYQYIIEAINEKKITKERIDLSYKRIKDIKIKYKIMENE